MKKTVLQTIHNLLNPEWWHFEYRYWRSKTPWDTQITPPEVMEYIRRTQPGRALDLGCGTGTNAIVLTRHGWHTVGVDFSPKAIVSARKKAARNNLKIDFYVGDVTNLNFLKGPFDYVLDIGCFFTLKRKQQIRYVSEVSNLTPSGADFMLYAWLPRQHKGRRYGISAQDVADLFSQSFLQVNMVKGKDGPGESAWYWFTRK